MDSVFSPIGFMALMAVALAALAFAIYFIVELLEGAKRTKSVEQRVWNLQEAVDRIEKAGKRASAPKRR